LKTLKSVIFLTNEGMCFFLERGHNGGRSDQGVVHKGDVGRGERNAGRGDQDEGVRKKIGRERWGRNRGLAKSGLTTAYCSEQ